jgi:hypothetical protein
LRAGDPEDVFLDRVKSRASFSGMRAQLIGWLDEIDLHRHLGLGSSAELWTENAQHLLHPTSCIRYPVLNNGTNYSGSSPTIVRSSMLRRYVEDVLSEELAQTPEALVVPLGKRVDEALSWLAARGAADSARILSGFPHPSVPTDIGIGSGATAASDCVSRPPAGSTRPSPVLPDARHSPMPTARCRSSSWLSHKSHVNPVRQSVVGQQSP